MANQQLIDYIKSVEKQGYTPEQLKDYLLKQGYVAADIDAAIAEANKASVGSPKTDVIAAESSSVGASKRPGVVTFVAVVYIIVGLIFLVEAIGLQFVDISFISQFSDKIPNLSVLETVLDIVVLIITFINVIIGLLYFMIAYGLFKLKNWARILVVIFSVFWCISLILLPFGVLFIVFMFLKKSSQAFKDANAKKQ